MCQNAFLPCLQWNWNIENIHCFFENFDKKILIKKMFKYFTLKFF